MIFGWGTVAKLIAILAAIIVLGGMVYFSYRFVENLQNENATLSQDLATERAARQIAVANWEAAQARIIMFQEQAQRDRDAFNTILSSTVAAQTDRGKLIQEITRVVPGNTAVSPTDVDAVNSMSRRIDCLLEQASGDGPCPDGVAGAEQGDPAAAPGASEAPTP